MENDKVDFFGLEKEEKKIILQPDAVYVCLRPENGMFSAAIYKEGGEISDLVIVSHGFLNLLAQEQEMLYDLGIEHLDKLEENNNNDKPSSDA